MPSLSIVTVVTASSSSEPCCFGGGRRRSSSSSSSSPPPPPRRHAAPLAAPPTPAATLRRRQQGRLGACERSLSLYAAILCTRRLWWRSGGRSGRCIRRDDAMGAIGPMLWVMAARRRRGARGHEREGGDSSLVDGRWVGGVVGVGVSSGVWSLARRLRRAAASSSRRLTSSLRRPR